MKPVNFMLLLVLLLATTIGATAQSIEVDETDEFTGVKRKATSWETVAINGKFAGYMRFAEIGGLKAISFKMVLGSPGKVFAVQKDADLMLKLEDGNVVTLKNLESAVACIGCGAKGYGYSQAYGILTDYHVSEEDFKKLLNSKIVKLRIITSEGAVDQELKPKASDTLLAAIKLLVA